MLGLTIVSLIGLGLTYRKYSSLKFTNMGDVIGSDLGSFENWLPGQGRGRARWLIGLGLRGHTGKGGVIKALCQCCQILLP